ncbi:MAG: M28 family peptidase [Gloeobacteraceae cyanobacterium ES-bin-144]|nr:M28 family peptidase [Verrucomicrobiales bacterium]
MEREKIVVARPKLVRRMAFSILRIGITVGLTLGVTACLVMQPTFHSNPPAKLQAKPDLLRQHVRTLTESFGPRYHDKPDNLSKCCEFLIGKFQQAGAVTREQSYRVAGRDFKNVRAFFGPENAPRIVIGAHYDACDEGETSANPGADDNASGVAGLLELARLLQQKHPSNTTVELVAYCTEEPPYFASNDMGSYRHAELLKQENTQIKAAIILEMIGYFSDEPGSQRYPLPLMKWFYPNNGNFISLVGGVGDRTLIATTKRAMKGSAPLPVYSACIPRNWDFAHLSDHRNYWPFGYSAIMVTDTAFYRNSNYHKTTDTWQTLDYPRMAHVVTQVHQAVLRLAE